MRRLKLSRWPVGVHALACPLLMLALALVPRPACAQQADTLNISGTFRPAFYTVEIGADLAEVLANGYEHTWTLTLYGVTYLHEYVHGWWQNDELTWGLFEEFHTRVHATSVGFEFFGPDADILNEVVGAHFPSDAFLDLATGEFFDSSTGIGNGPYANWALALRNSAGYTLFSSGGSSLTWSMEFTADANGYPVVEPGFIGAEYSFVTDPGLRGALASYADVAEIGSSEPPVPPLPLPPPPPPTLSITDGSVREGNKGTTRLDLTVTLSRSVSATVTVKYATANGTARATQDYAATSGTLTFSPGQTSRTISIAIKTDRKREPNETFAVHLSNAVGATIADGTATATIVNDD
jgi:hypothetical protein